MPGEDHEAGTDPYNYPEADVPIVGLGPLDGDADADARAVAGALCDACRDVGFVAIADHGVPQDAIDSLFEVSRRFFERPLAEKLRYKSPRDLLFQGYACPGEGPGYHTSERQSFNVFRFDTAAEAVANGYPADIDRVMYDALWPDDPSEFRTVWRRYFAEMDALAARLLRAFEIGLRLPPGWFEPHLLNDPSTQAANYYSYDIDSGHEPSPFRFKAHRDSDVFTILYQDAGPGSLQLHEVDAGWRTVTQVPGAFVVNIGEVMARWTNDHLRATPHRVLAPIDPQEHQPRMSAPYFFKPGLDAVIEPIPELLAPDEEPRYGRYTGREWLLKLQADIDAGYDTTHQFEDLAADDPSLR